MSYCAKKKENLILYEVITKVVKYNKKNTII